jgi:hypothetical protein
MTSRRPAGIAGFWLGLTENFRDEVGKFEYNPAVQQPVPRCCQSNSAARETRYFDSTACCLLYFLHRLCGGTGAGAKGGVHHR